MRKAIILILCSLPLALLAQKVNPEKVTAIWTKKLNIQLSYSTPDSQSFAPERKAGKNWLFEYILQDAESPEIADDEKTQIVGFCIPPVKGHSFVLKNEQLTKAKAYYMLGCFCKDRGFKLIHKGLIKGRRINATTWEVKATLIIDGSFAMEFKRKFRLRKS